MYHDGRIAIGETVILQVKEYTVIGIHKAFKAYPDKPGRGIIRRVAKNFNKTALSM